MNYGTAEGMRYYSEVGSKNKRRLRLTQGDQFSQVLIFTSKKKNDISETSISANR